MPATANYSHTLVHVGVKGVVSKEPVTVQPV